MLEFISTIAVVIAVASAIFSVIATVMVQKRVRDLEYRLKTKEGLLKGSVNEEDENEELTSGSQLQKDAGDE